ncbi:MAG: hypothetical protein Q9219_006771 [cf. Caloplaca sp. 3 TL-2023]
MAPLNETDAIIQYPAYGAISAAGCGVNLKCICTNDQFFITIQGVLAMGNCSVIEAQDAIVNTRKICLEAAPSLGHDRGPEFFGAITVLLVLATVAVALRFLARYGNMAYALCNTHPGLSAIHHGCGKHLLVLDMRDIVAFSKAFFATTVIFPVGCVALKFSILFFYHRIFATRKFTLWCVAIAVVTTAWFIAFIVSQFLTCRPLPCYWDKTIPNCKCINAVHVGFYITSPPDILTNIAILILPIPWLWGLHLQTKKKVALTCIFVLGSFSVLGSILRIPFLADLNFNDISYTVVNSGLWLNVELAIGILSASLPLMRPLVSGAFPSEIRSRFSRSRTTGSQRLPEDKTPHRRHGSNSYALSASRTGKALDDDDDRAGDVYAGGGGGKRKGWLGNLVSEAKGTRRADDAESGEGSGSEVGMVPMGGIRVTRDVEWECEGGGVGDSRRG